MWPWQLQVEARTKLSARVACQLLGVATFVLCGYLHVPLSFHQRVNPPSASCSVRASGNVFSWLVVVINLSQSAFYATSAVHRM